MIEGKDAVEAANRFLRNMLGENLRDLRLEEIELSQDGQEWHITLSFLRRGTPAALSEILAQALPREYKVVAVSATTGDVRSMRIKQFA
jgi:hypothetical protein